MNEPAPEITEGPQVDEKLELLDRATGHYFVPEKIAEFVHEVIGEVDLDPCAHHLQLVRTKTKVVGSTLLGIDGLHHPLDGVDSVWLNPAALERLPSEIDHSIDTGHTASGKKRPPARRKITPDYPFHPMTEWLGRYTTAFFAGEIGTLMVYTPGRVGSTWWSWLLDQANLSLFLEQRVDCWLQQRDSEGDDLPPKLAGSPRAGSNVFLFTRYQEVYDRFLKAAAPDEEKEKPSLGVTVGRVRPIEAPPPAPADQLPEADPQSFGPAQS